MKKQLLEFFLLILFTCICNTTFSQSSCSISLSDAQDNFESGHLYGIPAILKPCLDNGFSKEERIQAYRLLTRTYLIIDDPISAEDSYLKLLKLDPEYRVDQENDPIEIVHLSQKFKTTPIFTWTVFKAGLNTTKAKIINFYSTGNSNNSSATNSSELGFQFGTSIELNVNDQWSLNSELMFAKRSLSHNNTLFGEDPLSLKENQLWLEIPFYVKYSRRYKQFHPYLYAGYSPQILLNANAEARLVNVEPSTTESVNAELPVTGPNVKMTAYRNRFNQAAIFGIGVRYKLKYRYLLFELRQAIGLKNLLKEDNQYGKSGDDYNSELAFRYGYIDSDFTINSTLVSIGYIHPFYKPRKIDTKPHFIQRLFRKKGGRQK